MAYNQFRQTENRIRRVVGMNRHLNIQTFGMGNNRVQKIFHIGEERVFSHAAVLLQRRAYGFHAFRFPSGHFIRTYAENGDPPASFGGEPVDVEISGELRGFAETVWDALDTDNRVSLYAREIDIQTGEYTGMIINKHM